MKRVSLATIAKIVGVSKPVVYTVLKNRQNKGIFVGKNTREKILKTARELAYVAPKSAKELFTGRSDNIGIIFHKLTPFFSELVSQLHQEAYKRNLEVTSYLTDGDADLEEHYLNLVRDGRVDAVITVATVDGSIKRYQRYVKLPYNLKVLYYGEPISGVPSVHFDEKEVGRLAGQHLAEIECRRLAFFGGNKNSARAEGFIQYLKENGLPAPLIFTSKKFIDSFPEEKILAREFLKLKSLPDGVFASNDLLAVALLSEVLKEGLRVPEDIAILGCDNTEICLYTNPTISSIDTNTHLLAKKAIEKIEKIIKGIKLKSFHTKIPAFLIGRESTKR